MKDPKTENWLGLHGYTWQFVAKVPIAKIDLKEAEANPARLGRALDEEYALSIGLAVQDGAELPAVVVLDRGEPQFDVMTGRHRIYGVTHFCKPAHDTIDAYVVREVDPYRVELLSRSINVIEGHAPDTTERLTHVAEVRRKFPHSKPHELASQFKLSTKQVNEYLRVLAMEKRADDLGVGHIVRNNRAFGLKTKADLNSIQNDNVFANAVVMVAKHHNDFRGTAGTTFAKELRAAGSERRALKYIEERDRELTEAEEQRKVKKSRSPSGRATMFVGAARSLLKKYPGTPDKLYLEGLGTTCNELKRELKVLKEARNALDDVEGALEKLIADMERQEEWRKKPAAARGEQNYGSTSPH
jgi:hypothetical protein